jgi:hypothetical protein
MAAATRDAANASSQALSEAREARLAEMAPRIMVYLDPAMTYMANVVIENVGRGTARNLSFQWNPPIRVIDQPNKYDPMQFFVSEKAMVPPGFRIRHLLDAWPNLFAAELPGRYEVTVQYEGLETDRAYSVTHILDIAAMKHRTDSYEKNMSDLVEILEKHTANLDRGLKSLERELREMSISRSYVPAEAHSVETAATTLLAFWELYKASRQVESAHVPWKAYLHQLRRYALGAYCQVRTSNGSEVVLDALRAIVMQSFGLRVEHRGLGSDPSKEFDVLFEDLKMAIG